MPCRIILVALLAAVSVTLIAAESQSKPPRPATSETNQSRQLADFSLPTHNSGQPVSLSDDPSVKLHVICFLGTECPLARVYGPRLQRMADQFSGQGVRFIGINSNVQDSLEEIDQYRREHGIKFPIGKDHDQAVALQAGATRTPEVFIVDSNRVICYQGRIDDQYQPGVARDEAQSHDLRDAISELLAGQPVSKPQQKAVGCLIALPRKPSVDTDVTYCDEVIRILQRNCIECHREGQIGPFVLDDYDEVVGWGDMSIEVIEQGRMPPWHADPNVGQFANARQMSDEDKETLRQWVDAGMPYGDADDLPPPRTYADGWRMSSPPDKVVKMSEVPFQIPAEGTVEYQYFVVDPGFTKETWVRAAQVIPGNAAVVHHCIVFQRPPDGESLKGAGMFAAYIPGQISSELPDGYAYRIAAGAHLVFQMHYTPNGKPQNDLSQLGMVLADPEELTHEVYVINGINTEFEIPPHTPKHVVTGLFDWFPSDGMLLSITPHMHVRGKAFELFTHRDGKREAQLRVPAYDFNWQHDYDLAQPLPLGDVKKISFAATFDNSTSNPFNPNPDEYVTWGDQTWEEMAVVFLRVAEPIDRSEQSADPEKLAEQNDAHNEMQWNLALEFADKYINRFDGNDDGVLSPREVPKSVRAFRFHDFDRDGDGYLAREEMAANALDRYRQAAAAGAARTDGQREF